MKSLLKEKELVRKSYSLYLHVWAMLQKGVDDVGEDDDE
jgi:hypothetical protein